MSYRLEKEENGVKAIVIDGWEKGIADDPYSGMNRMLQVNLNTPGEVSVGYPITTATQSTGTMTVPIHDATNIQNGSATAYFILDDTSQVFKSTGIAGPWSFLSTSNTTTGALATNQGLAYWKGYLFKFRNSSIDYLATGAGTWVTGWNPATGAAGSSGIIVADVNHFALVSQDDALYFTNGPGVGSLLEVAGSTFDPTNTATYTYAFNSTGSANALKLPAYDTAQSLAEQSTNLLVGGSLNAIYPWDRISTSFSYPIFIADMFIKRMVTANTNVYVFAGNANGRGRIYVTNSSQADLFYKIPDYIFGEQDPYYEWGDAIWHRNNLIFGFFVTKNSGAAVLSSTEVWAIDLESEAFRSISEISSSSGKANAKVLISGLGSSPGMGYIVAWDNLGSTSGIGYSGTTAGIGSSSLQTDLIPVGSFLESRTFNQVEVKLRSSLQSGESLQIQALTNPDQATVVVGTMSTVGTMSEVFTVNFEKIQWLQFQLLSTGNSATSGVRLKEIRIR